MTEALESGPIVQVAVVVEDIEAKARAWAGLLGLPVPEISLTDTVDVAHTQYGGQPTTARAKLAFFRFGDVALELIEPVGRPSTWRDQLEEHGDSLHHIAFRIQGMGEVLALLGRKSIPLIQRGEYTGGRYAYVDAVDELGLVLELLEND
jgi:catechol 2,3-dioxygenase-like lactoylglutathione lyase family enzyme